MTIPIRLAWGVGALLSLAIVAVSSRYFATDPEMYFPDQREVYVDHTALLLTHIVGATIALAIGPFQFLPAVLRRRPLHRWLGRLYLAGILVGGLGGLGMAQLAFGGAVSEAGFSVLAVVWLVTGGLALTTIRQGRVAQHREWMIRNLSLTFAAVTLRLWLPGLAEVVEFETAYRTVAWLSWVPNLMVAEWIIRRQRSKRVLDPNALSGSVAPGVSSGRSRVP